MQVSQTMPHSPERAGQAGGSGPPRSGPRSSRHFNHGSQWPAVLNHGPSGLHRATSNDSVIPYEISRGRYHCRQGHRERPPLARSHTGRKGQHEDGGLPVSLQTCNGLPALLPLTGAVKKALSSGLHPETFRKKRIFRR